MSFIWENEDYINGPMVSVTCSDSITLTVEGYVSDNPYSWNIDYFDDWRCVYDYLKAKATSPSSHKA